MSNCTEVPIWKRYFWRNTASNYLKVITRLVLGLFLFRLLFSSLSDAQFGFWSLLWSLFGYGILLDFGLGFTAQKAVAEKTTTQDWEELSSLLSTLVWTFVGLAVIMGGFFFLVRDAFLGAIDIPTGDTTNYKNAYAIFFAGLILTFPLGLFPEVLRGLQRIDLVNWLGVASSVLHFIGIFLALKAGLSLTTVITVSIITTLLPNIGALYFVRKKLPRVSLSPKHFRLNAVRPQISFSMIAYLNTFGNLLIAKSDQMVVSLTLGVSMVAAYQFSYKVAEMLNLFTMQLQEALSPAAASMNASGDTDGLKDLLLKISQLTFLVSTPLYGLCAVYLKPLIQLLTGLDTIEQSTMWVGQILLFAIYSSQLTNSCSKRILMMCGYEKKLLKLTVIEGLSNICISVSLAFSFGIVGVALGTLIPAVIVGWFLVLPLALRYLHLPLWSYARYLLASSTPILLFAVSLGLTMFFLPMPNQGGFFNLALRSGLAAGPAFLLILLRIRKTF